MTRKLLAALVIASLLNGCSQATRIITQPEGSKVYVDGKFIGVSPVVWVVKDSDVSSKRQFDVRIERAGYQPYEGTLSTYISAGRVISMIFTLGIVALFRTPRVIAGRYSVNLYPIAEDFFGLQRQPAQPVPVYVAPSLAPGADSVPPRSPNWWVQSLRDLESLRKDGLISDDEYQKFRATLMRSMTHGTGDTTDY
jgi:hypothetical protein